MELQSKYKNLKVIITACILSLFAAISYIYELKDKNASITKENKITTNKKSDVLIELAKLNNNFVKIAKDNPTIEVELNLERDKMFQLMEKIGKTPEEKISFLFYNKEINGFYDRLTKLRNKSDSLTQINNQKPQSIVVNEIIVDNQKSVKKVKNLTEKVNVKTVNEIEKTVIPEVSEYQSDDINKLEKLKISGLKIQTYSQKKPHLLEKSDIAQEVEVVKVGFTIPQNFVAKPTTKNYYVQILDSKKNFAGIIQRISFETGEKLTYSFVTTVSFKGKAVSVLENFYFKNFKKGTYTVKIFDKGKMLSKTNFILN